MFVDCEKWRKDFGLDHLVRTFDYQEKAEVFKYYPQYYHKTDKVYISNHLVLHFTPIFSLTKLRMDDQYT